MNKCVVYRHFNFFQNFLQKYSTALYQEENSGSQGFNLLGLIGTKAKIVNQMKKKRHSFSGLTGMALDILPSLSSDIVLRIRTHYYPLLLSSRS